jgi:hypothetical protein
MNWQDCGELSLTDTPVFPSITESRRPGTLYATTGVPIALDSATANRQPSQTEGIKNICTFRRRLYF